MQRLLPMTFLVFTFLALSERIGLPSILLGLAVAAGILALLRPARGEVKWRRVPAASLAVCIYLLLLVRNVVASGFQMAAIILSSKMPLKPGIVAVPTACRTERGQALSAHAISLPPGELAVEAGEDGTMYIHSLNVDVTAKHALQAQKIQKKLLKKIFD